VYGPLANYTVDASISPAIRGRKRTTLRLELSEDGLLILTPDGDLLSAIPLAEMLERLKVEKGGDRIVSILTPDGWTANLRPHPRVQEFVIITEELASLLTPEPSGTRRTDFHGSGVGCLVSLLLGPLGLILMLAALSRRINAEKQRAHLRARLIDLLESRGITIPQ